jgi:hypothetical protein
MNKDLKITLGLIVVTAVGYHLWKMSQSSTPVALAQNPGIVPNPTTPADVVSLPTPTTNFAAYANITADAKSGGFFQSEKVKLNY